MPRAAAAANRIPSQGIDDKIGKFDITDAEMADLVAFLKALTDTSLQPVPPESVPSGLPIVEVKTETDAGRTVADCCRAGCQPLARAACARQRRVRRGRRATHGAADRLSPTATLAPGTARASCLADCRGPP